MFKKEDFLHNNFLSGYQEVKNQLFNYFMIRLGFDRALAEDLFMDVILKAYDNFQKYDFNKGSFKTWIFTLARNHLFNYYRDNKKTVSLEKLEEEGVNAAKSEINEESEQQIEHGKIERVLNLMSRNEREVISMRYFEELEYPEIAKILDKKEGAIRTGLSRALERFKALYQKLYP